MVDGVTAYRDICESAASAPQMRLGASDCRQIGVAWRGVAWRGLV